MARDKKLSAALRLSKPHNGCFRKCVGMERSAHGKLYAKRFHLGSNAVKAQLAVERLHIEWTKLKREGKDAWTDEVLNQLESEGVLDPPVGKMSKAQIASMLDTRLPQIPLTSFADEKGETQPEYAQQALDYVCRTLVVKPSVIVRFQAQVWESLQKDPLAAIERLSRLFGWSAKDAQTFIGLTVNSGSGATTNLDATSNGGKSVLDLIEGEIIVPADMTLPANMLPKGLDVE